MTVSTRPRGLPRRRVAADKSFTVVDLTGGLDLYRDGSQLEPNYTSDLLNVDPLVGGGVKRRKGVTVFTATTAPARIDALSTYVTSDGYEFVMASANGNVYQVRKSGYTQVVSTATPETVWRSVQVYDKGYFYDSTRAVDWTQRFVCTRTGAPTVTPVNPGFNNATPKYGTYASGGIPIARAMAFWHGRLWGANTRETGVDYQNRVRWSYPIVNNVGAEDWHYDDYLTANETGEPILALVPQGERLLVFKAGSVEQITGWDETNFVRTLVLDGTGAASAAAIAVLGGAVYFWDVRFGLCRLASDSNATADSPAFTKLSTRILPLVQRTAPKVAYDVIVAPTGPLGPDLSLALKPGVQVYLGAVEDRIWCSVTRVDDNDVDTRQTLVFDPKLGNGAGGWTIYDLQLGPFLTAFKEGYEQYGLDYLAASKDSRLPIRLLRLEIDSLDYDDFGTSIRSIPSHFRTGWLADGTPFQRKRWGLVQAILDAGYAQSFGVEVYADWDQRSLKDSLTFNNPDSTTAAFETNRSLMAPTMYELKRPAGLAGPGANALYPLGGSVTVATWDDAITTWDSPDRDWEGNYWTPSTGGTETYAPPVPLPVPCPDPTTYDRFTGASRTGYEFQNLNLPTARAVQFLVVGALPSKEWALRGIMVTYREVEG